MPYPFLSHPFLILGEVQLTLWGLGTFMLTVVGLLLSTYLARRLLARTLTRVAFLRAGERSAVVNILSGLILIFGLLASIESLGFAVGKPLLTLGGTGISLYSLATSLALAWAVLTGSQIVSRWVAQGALTQSHVDEGLRYAIGRIIYYVLMVLGMMAVLQTLGIQMGSLTVLVGALGVGIGFGLQNIVNNFVSGLILLFERPIKVGDWIDLEGTSGKVTDIGARSTKVVTADNITVILPNGDCLSQKLINWSYNASGVRFRIPISVAYGSDMALVKRLLLEVGLNHPKVLDSPAPKVLFKEFGDSSLNLELGIWIRVDSIGRQQLYSDINFAIEKAFRDNDIEIPFPQRDLRVRTTAPTQLGLQQRADNGPDQP